MKSIVNRLCQIVCAGALSAQSAALIAEDAPVEPEQATEESAEVQAAPEAAAPEAALPAPAPEAQAAAPANSEGSDKPDFVSEGKRVAVRDGDFSLIPPTGWQVYTHLPSLTLLAQVPHQPGMKYQRTIQVASFSGSRFIDETTAKEYEEIIVRKFSQTTSAMEGYRIRNHMNIEMADGREGILFYTEFTLEGVNLMQAHILVSSRDRHYLMTFTDVAEHFESDAANKFLTEAWDSMISVELGSKTPARFEMAGDIVIGAVVLALLSLVVVGVRRYRAGRDYKDYANGKDLSDVELNTQHGETEIPTSLPPSSAYNTLNGSKIEGSIHSKNDAA